MTFYEKIKKMCRTSLFISLIMRLVHAIYNCLREGMFGRFMMAYPAEERLFRNGIIGSFFSRRGAATSLLRKLRLRLAEFFEKSLLLGIGSKKATYLLGCSLRIYGIFGLSFGVYTILIYYIKFLAFSNVSADMATLILGAVFVVLSIPMLGSRHSVAELLQKGILPHLLLIDIFGISEERLDITRVKQGGRYNVALLFGVFFGILTFVIPPLYIVLFMASILVVALVMSYPEIGVLALIALTPFLSVSDVVSRTLEFGIVMTALAYLGKLIRGKRVFHLSLVDVMMAFVGLLLWLSGVVSVGGENSVQEAGHFCLLLLMYFMIVNLIRTPAWLHRAILAGVGPTSLLAIVGLIRYLNGDFSKIAWMFAASSNTGLEGRTFTSISALVSCLLLVLPFTIAVLFTANERKNRLVTFGCVLAQIAVLVFADVRGAWVGATVAVLLFLLIYSRKTACSLILIGVTVPIWWGFLPRATVQQLLGIADMTDPAIYQRLGGWKGTLRMLSQHLFGGIGFGSAAFGEMYPQYSLSGLEQLGRPDQFYLALICAFGVLGLAVFVIFLTVFSQYCFSYIGNASESYSRTFVAAGFSGIIGALVMGFGSDIWYDKTVFLTFITVAALTCAYVRTGIAIRTRNRDVSGTDVSHAYLDLNFDN